MKISKRVVYTALFLFASGYASFSQIRMDKVVPGENIGLSIINEKAIPKRIELKVLFVRLAEDDGSIYSFYTKSRAQEEIDEANKVYHSKGINFVIDPSSDFTSHSEGDIHDTVMSNECPAFANLAPELAKEELKKITKKDVNKDGKYDDKDRHMVCKHDLTGAKRAAYALQFPDKIVVFIRGGNAWAVNYDEKLGHWVLDEFAHRAYSGGSMYYVASGENVGALGHEIGHYLHLPHTNPYRIDTVKKAKEEINKYILKYEKEPEFNPQTDGLNVFDNDGIADTPPDAGGKIFEDFYGWGDLQFTDKCGRPGTETVPIDVTVKSKTYHFVLAPDLKNVMSYAHCFNPGHFTTGQKKVMYKALFEENRQPLVRPELVSCYKKKGIDKGLLLGMQRKPQTLSQLQNLIKKRLEIIESCLNGSKNPYLNVDVKNTPKVTLPLNQLPPPGEMD